jgi:hypothetical protein
MYVCGFGPVVSCLAWVAEVAGSDPAGGAFLTFLRSCVKIGEFRDSA